ncbi:unnamed protein product [Effrenium voratum]|nr:unnamed protein product [Effrenium voratum]
MPEVESQVEIRVCPHGAESTAWMAGECEVFLGGLPHEPELLDDLELALREALIEFAAEWQPDATPADVRLRLHTSRRSDCRGLGYGFAWLPPSAGAELLARNALRFELRGQQYTALPRAAKGHARNRGPPPARPVATCLEITAFSDLDHDGVMKAVSSWSEFLLPWGVGLELRHFQVSFGDLPKVGPGDGIYVLGTQGSLPRSALESLRGAPVLVLAAENPGDVEADVLTWAELGVEGDRGCCEALVAWALRRSVASHLSGRLKVFVCDCDHTLWGGVVAEDGVEELDMGGPFGLLQEKVSKLQELGCLVCLASRNEEEDVLRVFSEREMALKKEQLASWQVHWGSKVSSLRRLASELRLGLEAFVFLDDNPAEVEAVRQSLPEVLTVTIPSERDAFTALLRRHWALDAWRTNGATVEDARRTQMYREAAQRKLARQKAPNFQAFLQSLEVKIELRRPCASELARVCQLSLRTNQMNSTGLRFASEAVLQEWLGDGHWILAAWVSDRFGDYGLVGCAFCAETEVLVVECLCMSCRVLHRGVEEALLRSCAESADGKVMVPFLPTPRNELMRRFLARVASWAEVSEAEAGATVALGRHGGRRGILAPAMALPAAKLRSLRGENTLDEDEAGNEELQSDAKEVKADARAAVDWSALLSSIAQMGLEAAGGVFAL